MAEKRTFAGKFIAHLEKIDRSQVENFLATLLREKNFLQLIFDNLLEGVIVTDENSQVLFLNSTARELLGLSSRKQRLGQSLSSVIQDPALKAFLDSLDSKKTVSPLASDEIEVSFPKPSIYGINVVPIQDKKNQISAYLIIIADVTEKRLRELQRQQHEKLVSLATLTAGVAHEIKNPLNSLNIHAQILKKVIQRCPSQTLPDFERIKRSIEVITEETNRLGHIVDQFILAVRPTKPHLSPVNVNKVLHDVAELMRTEIESKNISLELTTAPDVPSTRLDEQRIRQAFLNIVKNSIEAIDNQNGEIHIQSSILDNFVQISFHDNGCGIKKEDLTKVFEPYYSTKFYGTGLGLMIVYRVIQEHKGKINVQSEPGKGTNVTVLLPLSQKPLKLLEEKVP